ncbi:hypothetical protein BMS3Bbin15_00458 [archaeon BMS3Bbin15]|nr:hypothetical protein BMS3Bbin15_00458 [archaeon BMS3Bbin15]
MRFSRRPLFYFEKMLKTDNKKEVCTESYSTLSCGDNIVSYTILLLEGEGYFVIEQRLDKEVWI